MPAKILLARKHHQGPRGHLVQKLRKPAGPADQLPPAFGQRRRIVVQHQIHRQPSFALKPTATARQRFQRAAASFSGSDLPSSNVQPVFQAWGSKYTVAKQSAGSDCFGQLIIPDSRRAQAPAIGPGCGG